MLNAKWDEFIASNPLTQDDSKDHETSQSDNEDKQAGDEEEASGEINGTTYSWCCVLIGVVVCWLMDVMCSLGQFCVE